MDLLTRREIQVDAVLVSEVIAGYLSSYQAESPDLEMLSGFLLLVARLLAIKAKMLLPEVELCPEEVEELALLPEILERHQQDYRQFKEAAAFLKDREEDSARLISRSPDAGWAEAGNKLIWDEIAVEDLTRAFATIITRKNVHQKLKQAKEQEILALVRPTKTLKEKTGEINDLLKQHTQGIFFEEFFPTEALRWEIVITFIALLELVRQGRISIAQDELFGRIKVILCPRPFGGEDDAHAEEGSS